MKLYTEQDMIAFAHYFRNGMTNLEYCQKTFEKHLLHWERNIKKQRRIIGYKVLENCTLEYTNFEAGDKINIERECENSDWLGTDFYDALPQIFQPIYGRNRKPITPKTQDND